MLAYTAMSDLFYMPSPLEAGVYLGGFLFVLALPYIFLSIIDKQSTAKVKKSAENNVTEPQAHS